LLRLQARRVSAPEARTALEESMRRVSSIALVHETLSVSMDESVDFDNIVDRLMRMLSDLTGSTGRIAVVRAGTFGELPAEMATALVLVLTELVQNAIEHGFAAGANGTVEVNASRVRGKLAVHVIDDGNGLPADFNMHSSDRLGLQIVRTLIATDLSGSIDLRARSDGGHGTEAAINLPIARSSTN
jgi:two-component sensor histidine kinase